MGKVRDHSSDGYYIDHPLSWGEQYFFPKQADRALQNMVDDAAYMSAIEYDRALSIALSARKINAPFLSFKEV